MGMNISISDGVILMTVTGPWGGPQSREALLKSGEAARINQIYRILIDIRQAEVEASTLDIYQVTSMLADHFTPVTRHAIVQSNEESLKAAGEFFETVASNRGILARCFTDKDEALSWLKK